MPLLKSQLSNGVFPVTHAAWIYDATRSGSVMYSTDTKGASGQSANGNSQDAQNKSNALQSSLLSNASNTLSNSIQYDNSIYFPDYLPAGGEKCDPHGNPRRSRTLACTKVSVCSGTAPVTDFQCVQRCWTGRRINGTSNICTRGTCLHDAKFLNTDNNQQTWCKDIKVNPRIETYDWFRKWGKKLTAYKRQCKGLCIPATPRDCSPIVYPDDPNGGPGHPKHVASTKKSGVTKDEIPKHGSLGSMSMAGVAP